MEDVKPVPSVGRKEGEVEVEALHGVSHMQLEREGGREGGRKARRRKRYEMT